MSGIGCRENPFIGEKVTRFFLESIAVRGLETALGNFRGAVEALAETERTARRLLGSAHPVTAGLEVELRDARAALAARGTPSPQGA